MIKNMGMTDRSIRGVAGLVLLATALVGVCPAYLPFGLDTRRRAR